MLRTRLSRMGKAKQAAREKMRAENPTLGTAARRGLRTALLLLEADVTDPERSMHGGSRADVKAAIEWIRGVLNPETNVKTGSPRHAFRHVFR